jgi:hypothetical protein
VDIPLGFLRGTDGDDAMDDDDKDEDDPFEMLDKVECEQLMESTTAMCAMLNKVWIVTLCSNR